MNGVCPVKQQGTHNLKGVADPVKFVLTASHSNFNNNINVIFLKKYFTFTDPLQFPHGPLGVRGPPVENH